jgi:hypothetical protein
MKYIITESKLEKVVINWLNDNFGDLIPFETNDFIFYRKNEDVILDYNKKNGVTYIDYDNIWSFFTSYFNMSYNQIQHLTKEWIEERYKLKVSTTARSF